MNATTGTGYTYQWYLNGSMISGAFTSSYTANLGGNYSVEITSSANCMATSVNTTVTVNSVPSPTIINTGGVLSVGGGPYTSYQWYLNSSPIPGATNATYTVTQNGTYRVQVNKDGCAGSSNIMTLTGVGIDEINLASVVISPNPTNGLVHIEGLLPARIVIRNMQGQTIKEANDVSDISLLGLANGMYTLQLYDQNQSLLLTKKIVKQ
ncbi:hypothetical protein EMGBS15_10680 [Filimonas sp.]|nr:hypothetical protein EMGBS15_10680 [Filimonas sp.]